MIPPLAALLYALCVTLEIPITRADLLRSSIDPALVPLAIELDPILPDPYLLKAEILELHAQDSREAWARASLIAPRDPEPYIRQALAREQRGEIAQAERLMLQAEAVHATWYPRWTLANFYARQGNSQASLHWARRCAERASGDLRPLFVLIESLGVPPQKVPSYLPARNRQALAAYLAYRARHPQIDALEDAAQSLLEAIPSHPPGWPGLDIDPWAAILRPGSVRLYPLADAERSLLLLAWNRLADQSLGRRTVLFQNQLATHFPNWVPPWNPDCPIPANGIPSLPPGSPFDWHHAASEAIRIDSDAAHKQLTVSLTGSQPEQFDLLSRLVFLEAQTRYRFTSETQCPTASSSSGLTWELHPTATASSPALTAALRCNSGSKSTTFEIPPLAQEQLILLVLHYQRPIGQARLPIEFQIHSLAIERKP